MAYIILVIGYIVKDKFKKKKKAETNNQNTNIDAEIQEKKRIKRSRTLAENDQI